MHAELEMESTHEPPQAPLPCSQELQDLPVDYTPPEQPLRPGESEEQKAPFGGFPKLEVPFWESP